MIHVPGRLDGDDPDGDRTAPAKKKTRRGSRGGKNRRKKPAGALATAEAGTVAETGGSEHDPEPQPDDQPDSHPDTEPEQEPEREAAEGEPAEIAAAESERNGDWGYTPMSQWGLDE